ncbi:MAG TPA: hypothetical protein VJV78_05635 [Polyangiales bacterium]|nr:hypothetical protein [Polyangiales bacterium]
MTMVLLCAACSKSESHEARDAAADGGEMPALPNDVAGKGCKRDSDCKTGRCERSLQIAAGADTLDAPGGYCTTDCTTDTQCGRGGQCSVPAGADVGQCRGECKTDDQCREGYKCIGASDSFALMFTGTCQPKPEIRALASGVVGRTCVSEADCAGGRCAATSPLGPAFPGNYCTARCFEDAQCGVGGACLVFEGSADPGHCFERCSSDSDCTREHYRCVEIHPGLDACYPAPRTFPDHTTGKACDSDAACGGVAKSCVDELPFGTFSAYEPVAAPGGYCTQECALDTQCGAGAQCITRGVMGGLCLASCTQTSDCREGYQCLPHTRSNNLTERVCVVPLL